MTEDTQNRLGKLMEQYPELIQYSQIAYYLLKITMSKEDIDESFEKLEAILKEGTGKVKFEKIMKERYLYCDLPIYVTPKLYNQMKKIGAKIPKRWRVGKL